MTPGGDREQVAKSISRFLPVTTQPVEESERHYTQVHFPWAQRMLAQREQVISYHTNVVRRQYDQVGRWGRRPTAWRFVLLTFEPGRSLEFDQRTLEAIAQDHPNCLRDLRGTPVDEKVVLDRLSGQTALAKYVVEFDRPDRTGAEEAERCMSSIVDGLADQLEGAPGFRILRVNRVLGEARSEPVVDPGQRTTGEMLSSTDKTGYLELYFDDVGFGERFFARDEALELLDDPYFKTLGVYEVEERCGLDRR